MQIVGGVVVFHNIVINACLLKQGRYDTDFLQEVTPLLESYNTVAHNQKPCGEYEQDLCSGGYKQERLQMFTKHRSPTITVQHLKYE